MSVCENVGECGGRGGLWGSWRWGSVAGKFLPQMQGGETTTRETLAATTKNASRRLQISHSLTPCSLSRSLALSFHQAPLTTIAAVPCFPPSRPAGGLQATVVCAAAATEAPEEAVAFLRYSRGSAQKVRRVLDQIRGRSYEEALMMLEYMPYQACEPVIKTLLSAAANAKNNLGMKKKDLYVSECFADEGPVMKRFRPRAQGRANRILKPTVHITVKVAEREA